MPEAPLVLIIDDDPIVHKMLSTWLWRADYKVVGAARGQEGLDLA